MILANKQLFDNLLKNESLTLNEKSHRRTWEYYYEQYHNVFRLFLGTAKQKRYQTNPKFMPFMFIMRHSLELFLKHLDCLNCNSEGDCWRYITDRNGTPYFQERKEIHAFDACNYYCLFLDNDTSFTNASTDKKLQWELTFHTIGDDPLWIIGTQYDVAISDILQAIRERKISINDVYLPLLFFLRHSLELKLKASIIDLGNVVNEQDRSKVNHTHSVKLLYDIFQDFVDCAIKNIQDLNLKEESIAFQKVTEQYKDAIQSLDANSYLFRFPKDRKGNDADFIPKSDCVSEILKLYRKSDSFLCYAVGVLYQAGVLKIGEDKEREYYE